GIGHSPLIPAGNEEMCHEEIYHRARVDFAAHHPGSRERNRSPYVAVELLIREQRLLVSSQLKSSVSACAQNDLPPRAAGVQWRHGRPSHRRMPPMNQFFLAAVPVVGFVYGVVRPPLGLPLPEDEDVPHREGIERERTDTRASVAARPDL